MRGVIVMSAFLFMGASTCAEPARTPCADAEPSSLVSTDYGIDTPNPGSGWKCSIVPGSSSRPFILWEREEKRFFLAEYKLSEFSLSESWDAPEKPEPLTSIRVYLELFLKDESVVDKQPMLRADPFRNVISGVFFGKGKNIVVYMDHTGQIENCAKSGLGHKAFIFRKDNSETILDVDCRCCTFDEFYTHAIFPALRYK
jgi:hypothetical protein